MPYDYEEPAHDNESYLKNQRPIEYVSSFYKSSSIYPPIRSTPSSSTSLSHHESLLKSTTTNQQPQQQTQLDIQNSKIKLIDLQWLHEQEIKLQQQSNVVKEILSYTSNHNYPHSQHNFTNKPNTISLSIYSSPSPSAPTTSSSSSSLLDINSYHNLLPSQLKLIELRKKHQNEGIERYRRYCNLQKFLKLWKIQSKYHLISMKNYIKSMKYYLYKSFFKFSSNISQRNSQRNSLLSATKIYFYHLIRRYLYSWNNFTKYIQYYQYILHKYSNIYYHIWKRWKNKIISCMQRRIFLENSYQRAKKFYFDQKIKIFYQKLKRKYQYKNKMKQIFGHHQYHQQQHHQIQRITKIYQNFFVKLFQNYFYENFLIVKSIKYYQQKLLKDGLQQFLFYKNSRKQWNEKKFLFKTFLTKQLNSLRQWKSFTQQQERKKFFIKKSYEFFRKFHIHYSFKQWKRFLLIQLEVKKLLSHPPAPAPARASSLASPHSHQPTYPPSHHSTRSHPPHLTHPRLPHPRYFTIWREYSVNHLIQKNSYFKGQLSSDTHLLHYGFNQWKYYQRTHTTQRQRLQTILIYKKKYIPLRIKKYIIEFLLNWKNYFDKKRKFFNFTSQCLRKGKKLKLSRYFLIWRKYQTRNTLFNKINIQNSSKYYENYLIFKGWKQWKNYSDNRSRYRHGHGHPRHPRHGHPRHGHPRHGHPGHGHRSTNTSPLLPIVTISSNKSIHQHKLILLFFHIMKERKDLKYSYYHDLYHGTSIQRLHQYYQKKKKGRNSKFSLISTSSSTSTSPPTSSVTNYYCDIHSRYQSNLYFASKLQFKYLHLWLHHTLSSYHFTYKLLLKSQQFHFKYHLLRSLFLWKDFITSITSTSRQKLEEHEKNYFQKQLLQYFQKWKINYQNKKLQLLQDIKSQKYYNFSLISFYYQRWIFYQKKFLNFKKQIFNIHQRYFYQKKYQYLRIWKLYFFQRKHEKQRYSCQLYSVLFKKYLQRWLYRYCGKEGINILIQRSTSSSKGSSRGTTRVLPSPMTTTRVTTTPHTPHTRTTPSTLLPYKKIPSYRHSLHIKSSQHHSHYQYSHYLQKWLQYSRNHSRYQSYRHRNRGGHTGGSRHHPRPPPPLSRYFLTKYLSSWLRYSSKKRKYSQLFHQLSSRSSKYLLQKYFTHLFRYYSHTLQLQQHGIQFYSKKLQLKIIKYWIKQQSNQQLLRNNMRLLILYGDSYHQRRLLSSSLQKFHFYSQNILKQKLKIKNILIKKQLLFYFFKLFQLKLFKIHHQKVQFYHSLSFHQNFSLKQTLSLWNQWKNSRKQRYLSSSSSSSSFSYTRYYYQKYFKKLKLFSFQFSLWRKGTHHYTQRILFQSFQLWNQASKKKDKKYFTNPNSQQLFFFIQQIFLKLQRIYSSSSTSTSTYPSSLLPSSRLKLQFLSFHSTYPLNILQLSLSSNTISSYTPVGQISYQFRGHLFYISRLLFKYFHVLKNSLLSAIHQRYQSHQSSLIFSQKKAREYFLRWYCSYKQRKQQYQQYSYCYIQYYYYYYSHHDSHPTTSTMATTRTTTTTRTTSTSITMKKKKKIKFFHYISHYGQQPPNTPMSSFLPSSSSATSSSPTSSSSPSRIFYDSRLQKFYLLKGLRQFKLFYELHLHYKYIQKQFLLLKFWRKYLHSYRLVTFLKKILRAFSEISRKILQRSFIEWKIFSNIENKLLNYLNKKNSQKLFNSFQYFHHFTQWRRENQQYEKYLLQNYYQYKRIKLFKIFILKLKNSFKVSTSMNTPPTSMNPCPTSENSSNLSLGYNHYLQIQINSYHKANTYLRMKLLKKYFIQFLDYHRTYSSSSSSSSRGVMEEQKYQQKLSLNLAIKYSRKSLLYYGFNYLQYYTKKKKFLEQSQYTSLFQYSQRYQLQVYFKKLLKYSKYSRKIHKIYHYYERNYYQYYHLYHSFQKLLSYQSQRWARKRWDILLDQKWVQWAYSYGIKQLQNNKKYQVMKRRKKMMREKKLNQQKRNVIKNERR